MSWSDTGSNAKAKAVARVVPERKRMAPSPISTPTTSGGSQERTRPVSS